MHLYLTALALTLSAAACASTAPEAVPPSPEASPAGDAATFRYDPSSGRCVNSAGSTGYNAVDFKAIGATDNAECVDLSRQTLARNASARDVDWRKVSFRGANLRDTLFPAYNGPRRSDFSGADIRGAFDEYTGELIGTVDQHTKLDASCTEADGQARCLRSP